MARLPMAVYRNRECLLKDASIWVHRWATLLLLLACALTHQHTQETAAPDVLPSTAEPMDPWTNPGQAVPLLHGLAIRHDEEHGYHVVATQDLAAGTCILQEAPTAIGCTPQPAGPEYCRACLRPLSDSNAVAITCQQCHSAHWCRLECQQQDAATHKSSGECMLYQLPDVCVALGSWCREVTLVLRLHHKHSSSPQGSAALQCPWINTPQQGPQQQQQQQLSCMQQRVQQQQAQSLCAQQQVGPSTDDHAGLECDQNGTGHTWVDAPLESHVHQLTAQLEASQGAGWLDKLLHLLCVLRTHTASSDYQQLQPDRSQQLQNIPALRQRCLELLCTVLVNAVEVQCLNLLEAQQAQQVTSPNITPLEACEAAGSHTARAQAISSIGNDVPGSAASSKATHMAVSESSETRLQGLPPIALYRHFSRLNHSCCPNTQYHVRCPSGHVQVTLVQPVHAGQEVCITYVDPQAPVSERRQELYEKYRFWCQCSLCSMQTQEIREKCIRTAADA